MPVQLFTNNAASTIASSVSSVATSVTVAAGKGSLFPSPTGGDYFTLTLTQGNATETSWEIVKCTSRSTDVLTIVRAQEGTTAAAWASGDKAELRLTAVSLSAAVSSVGDLVGPASATDNAIARFDLATGKLIQDSLVTVSDTGAITAPQVGSLIPFYYANQAAFPSAATSHGAIAHSHSDGAMYFAHGGNWVRIIDTDGPLGTPASGTATNITGLPLSTGVTGTLPVANGGTGTTIPAIVAGTNVTVSGTWPNQTINSTASGGGSGTVTSVAATVPAFLSVTGSPITTSGTLAIALSGTALPVLNGGTGTTTPSIVAGTNVTVSGTWPNQTINSSGGGGASTSNSSLTRTYTGTGSQTAFTVTSGCTVDSVLVIQNGVVQAPTSDYTITSTTLSFVVAPASSDTIQIRELATGISSSGATSKSIAMALIFGS